MDKQIIDYNPEKDLKIEIKFLNHDMTIDLNHEFYNHQKKNLMGYRQIIIILTNCKNHKFTIHGYNNKPNKLNVNKVGNICKSFEYSQNLCHHITPYKYSYICKNKDDDKYYTLKNHISDTKIINENCYFLENNSGNVENSKIKCTDNLCEYFANNKPIKIKTTDYNYSYYSANNKSYVTDKEIKIFGQIKKNNLSDYLIVIDNSNISILDYQICISTEKLTNNDINKYIEMSKQKQQRHIIDTNVKKTSGEIIFGKNNYKLNKCENNICKKIQKTDYLLYGNKINNNTIINVSSLKKLIDDNKNYENINMKCYNKKSVNNECYLTSVNIQSKQLLCNRVDDNIICLETNVTEPFEDKYKKIPLCNVSTMSKKCNKQNNNIFSIILILISTYLILRYF